MTGLAYDAVLFESGALTSTTPLHAACWKRAFDAVLDERFGDGDYLRQVDGKPRHDGVRDRLRARGMSPAPAPVQAVADHTQALVEQALRRDGVAPFEGSLRWIEQLRAAGVRTAVVSASRNCRAVLRAAGIEDLFDAVVDGADVERLGLRGKPAPDGFLHAAERLAVAPRDAVVVDDAPAGVAAGRRGGFGIVIGVARGTSAVELHAAGAHTVVCDLAELVR
jgi:alpha,alpha-trehalose phosphorylase